MVRRIPIQFSTAPAEQLDRPLRPAVPRTNTGVEKAGNYEPLSLVPDMPDAIEQAKQTAPEHAKQTAIEQAKQTAPEQEAQTPSEQEPELRRELDRALRQVDQLAADLRNYKRHAEAQLASAHQIAKEEVLAELGDAMLSLEQAARLVDQDPDAVRQGVALVARGIQMVFDRHGLERIPTVGHPFDPALHEAVLVEQRPALARGTIVTELSPGFRSAQRVVRPAKVSVAG